MRHSSAVATFALALIVTLTLPAHAQRGGGRGSSAPPTLTAFESPANGISFRVPPDVSLFTPEAPGRFGQMFKAGYIAYLINLLGKDINIGLRVIPGVSDADLKQMQQTLETNPPQAKQPGYKKVSVGTTTIGAKNDREAVNYVFTQNNAKNEPVTTRQVAFMHNGKGFMIICVAPEKDFGAVDKKTFDALFHSLQFY